MVVRKRLPRNRRRTFRLSSSYDLPLSQFDGNESLPWFGRTGRPTHLYGRTSLVLREIQQVERGSAVQIQIERNRLLWTPPDERADVFRNCDAFEVTEDEIVRSGFGQDAESRGRIYRIVLILFIYSATASPLFLYIRL
jgi:hypothetical protein